MKSLELRVPPVIVVFATAACMWFVAETLPWFTVAVRWAVPVATGCAIAGISVALAGVAAFRKARTTVNPTTPEASSAIVASGVYRFSRNPMYAGFLLVLIGWGVYLSNLGALVLVSVFVVYMNRFQIKPEERALAAKFGSGYTEYMQRVRRWL